MSESKAFWHGGKQAAAILKHGVLRRYLPKFVGKLGSTSSGHRVCYLDGYAGRGEYEVGGGSHTEDGSPKIALRIASDMLVRDRHLVCTFVENDPESAASLERVVKNSGVGATVVRGDIRTELGPALDAFKGAPALVFLDPFGASLDHDLAIGPVLQRPDDAPTELLMNFSMEALRRRGGRIWEQGDRKGREATLVGVDRWLGGSWWREVFEAEPAGDNRANRAASKVLDAYVERVRRETDAGYFVVPIRRRPSHLEIFRLVLFHPRQHALFAFNEAVSLAFEDWRRHLIDLDKAEAAESLEFGALGPSELEALFKTHESELYAEAVGEIRQSILDNLRHRDTLSVRRDFHDVFGEAVGTARGAHLRRAWKELAAEGRVETPPSDLETGTIRRL